MRGEAAIGKSALVDRAAASAMARGMTVLCTTGSESEAHLPFAGLHQLLQPLLADLGRLPGPQRLAVEAAFGLSDAAAPDLFLIALATLELLGEAADRQPVLV